MPFFPLNLYLYAFSPLRSTRRLCEILVLSLRSDVASSVRALNAPPQESTPAAVPRRSVRSDKFAARKRKSPFVLATPFAYNAMPGFLLVGPAKMSSPTGEDFPIYAPQSNFRDPVIVSPARLTFVSTSDCTCVSASVTCSETFLKFLSNSSR